MLAIVATQVHGRLRAVAVARSRTHPRARRTIVGCQICGFAVLHRRLAGPSTRARTRAVPSAYVRDAPQVTGLLVAPVARFHWSHRLHLQRPSASVTEERPRLATPVRVVRRPRRARRAVARQRSVCVRVSVR